MALYPSIIAVLHGLSRDHRWIGLISGLHCTDPSKISLESIWWSAAPFRVHPPLTNEQGHAFPTKSICNCHLSRVRGLPNMTSAQRDGGQKIPQICNKQYIKFGQRGEGKAKKSEKFADIIYGSPLTPFHHAQVGKNNNFPYSWCIPPSLPWHWQKHRYMVTWWNLKMFRYIGYWM